MRKVFILFEDYFLGFFRQIYLDQPHQIGDHVGLMFTEKSKNALMGREWHHGLLEGGFGSSGSVSRFASWLKIFPPLCFVLSWR